MNIAVPPLTIGWILALIVLILDIVLFAVGRMPGVEAAFFGMLALARLL